MPDTCGVCNNAESKYKCPTCHLRYCSIPCYKSHKAIHDRATPATEQDSANGQIQQQNPVHRPGTTQRVPKIEFTGFEEDSEFLRLLSRYPSLRYQLQMVYGLSLEPGPDDGNGWSRTDWYPADRDLAAPNQRGGFRGRGRGQHRGRGHGGRGQIPQEDRMRGPWTQEKGEKQGREVLQRMRDSAGGSGELAEGMEEFIELCQMRFGKE